MKKYLIGLYIIIGLLVISCGEPVPLDIKLKDAQPRFSIYGRLDDNASTEDKIVVKKSVSYLNPADSINVAGATVVVKDESGNQWVFEYSGKGIYLPPADYVGVEIDKTYFLEVNYEGKQYTASSKVTSFGPGNPDPIVKDSVEKDDGGGFGMPVDTNNYNVFVFIKDDASKVNYYYFDVYRNDTLVTASLKGQPFTQVYVLNDDLFDEAPRDGVPYPVNFDFKLNDKVKYEVHSIDYETYKFYEALGTQINNGGTIFDGPPANVPGNISNGALGYFYATTSYTHELIVKLK